MADLPSFQPPKLLAFCWGACFCEATGGSRDGKEHRYYSIEESRRLQSGRVVQRRVRYLGEIHDSQPAARRKTLEVFDEQQPGYTCFRRAGRFRRKPWTACRSSSMR